MLIRIVAPHFVAGIDYPMRCAPIVKYMKGWSLNRIFDYCRSKGWKASIIGIEEKGYMKHHGNYSTNNA